jgi:hypothetical protein
VGLVVVLVMVVVVVVIVNIIIIIIIIIIIQLAGRTLSPLTRSLAPSLLALPWGLWSCS